MTAPIALGILSNHDIDSILKPLPFFIGTFSANTIPPIRNFKNPQAMVVNTARLGESGEHWVGLLINESRECYYFDPLGGQIYNIDILYSLQKMKITKYQYSTRQVQSFASNSCGYFCLAFVLAWKLKIPYDVFVDQFSEDLKKNDRICYDFIKKVINL